MFLLLPVKVGSDQDSGSLPVVNLALIAINLIIFILSRAGGITGGNFIFDVFIYAFMHVSLWHFIGNMWVLWVFGNKLNIRLGNFLYALIYLSATIGLGIFLRLLLRVDVVGASGCIFAVLAISLMLMPASMVSVLCVAFFPISLLIGLFSRPKHWALWFVRWGQFKIKGLWALLIIPVFELWSLVWQGWNWTNVGHLLGLACGVAIVLMLPKRISMNADSNSMRLSRI